MKICGPGRYEGASPRAGDVPPAMSTRARDAESLRTLHALARSKPKVLNLE